MKMSPLLYFHHSIPPTSLLPDSRYNKMAECFGAKGYHVTTPEELRLVLNEVMITKEDEKNGRGLPVIINIAINPSSERRVQVSNHQLVLQTLVMH